MVTSQNVFKNQTPNTNPTAAVALLMFVCVLWGKKISISFFSALLHFLSQWVRWDLQLIMRPAICRKVAAPINFVTYLQRAPSVLKWNSRCAVTLRRSCVCTGANTAGRLPLTSSFVWIVITWGRSSWQQHATGATQGNSISTSVKNRLAALEKEKEESRLTNYFFNRCDFVWCGHWFYFRNNTVKCKNKYWYRHLKKKKQKKRLFAVRIGCYIFFFDFLFTQKKKINFLFSSSTMRRLSLKWTVICPLCLTNYEKAF